MERSQRRFDRLVTGVLDDLYRLALSLERDPVRAEDLLQSSLVRALDRMHQLRSDEAFRAWTGRIVYTTFANDRARRREEILPPEHLDNVVNLDGSRPDREAESSRAWAQLSAALDALPSDQREAVWLVDGLGFRFAEAAEVLGVPMGTTASRVARGREALRVSLGELAREQGVRS